MLCGQIHKREMETCRIGIERKRIMNKKTFKEPQIPRELAEVRDARALMEAAREEEGEIFRRSFNGIFLSRIDGSHISFQQTAFQNCRFLNCCFDRASFTDVRFINCDFSNSSMNDVSLQSCAFVNCKALGTDFYGSSIRHVSMENCNFRDAGMDAVRMSYVKAYHTDFTEASLSKCNITNVDWKDDCFKNASFFKTWLKDIDLTECDITGIVISDAKDELRETVVNLEQAIALAKRLGIVIKELER